MSATERFYAYRCTDATGKLSKQITPGEYILEREYKGNGSFTWQVFDFGKPGTPCTGTMTGRYVAQVKTRDGKLTPESRNRLDHRPTRSEQSLEGAAVNGLTPVGQEDEL